MGRLLRRKQPQESTPSRAALTLENEGVAQHLANICQQIVDDVGNPEAAQERALQFLQFVELFSVEQAVSIGVLMRKVLDRPDRAYLPEEKEKLYESCLLALSGEGLLPASIQTRLRGPLPAPSPPPAPQAVGPKQIPVSQFAMAIGDRLYARIESVLNERLRESGGKRILCVPEIEEAVIQEAEYVQGKSSSIPPEQLKKVLDAAAKHAVGRLKQTLQRAGYDGELMTLVGPERGLAILVERCPTVREPRIRTLERKWRGPGRIAQHKGRVVAQKVGEVVGAVAGIPAGAVWGAGAALKIIWSEPAKMTGATVAGALAGGAVALLAQDPLAGWMVGGAAAPTAFWVVITACGGAWVGIQEGAERIGNFAAKFRAPALDKKLPYLE